MSAEALEKIAEAQRIMGRWGESYESTIRYQLPEVRSLLRDAADALRSLAPEDTP